jgi:hypothetical protein
LHKENTMIGLAVGLAALGFIAYKHRRHHHHWGYAHAHGHCHGRHRGWHGPDWDDPHAGRRGWGRGGPYRLMHFLGTTPGQEKAIREEADLLRERGRLAKEEVHAAKADLAEVLRADTFDRARYDAAMTRVDAAWANLKSALGDSIGRIHETLDARQRERLADFLASASSRRGPSFGPFR